MKVIAITQARYGSARLPGKVLLPIAGKTILEIHLERLKSTKTIDKLMVATTIEDSEEIVKICEQINIPYYKGSENDVLDRFYQAAKPENPDFVVRLTSDGPMLDAELVDEVVNFTIENDYDYTSNRMIYNYPDGIVVEVLKFSALERAWNEANLVSEREHVCPYIWKNSTFYGKDMFTSGNYLGIDDNYEGVRVAVDDPEDYQVVKKIMEKFGLEAGWQVYADAIRADEKLRKINSHIEKNEGYARSLAEDKIVK